MIFHKLSQDVKRQNSSELSKQAENLAEFFRDEFHVWIAVIEKKD